MKQFTLLIGALAFVGALIYSSMPAVPAIPSAGSTDVCRLLAR